MIKFKNDSEAPCMLSGYCFFLMLFYVGIKEDYYVSLTINFANATKLKAKIFESLNKRSRPLHWVL